MSSSKLPRIISKLLSSASVSSSTPKLDLSKWKKATTPFSTLPAQSATSVMVNHCSRNLEVRYSSAERETNPSDVFPFVWLRDNCRCSKCFEHNERLVTFKDFSIDVQPKEATITRDGDCKVVWDDGHESVFSEDFLARHSFRRDLRAELEEREARSEVQLWGNELEKDIPKADYKAIMRDDSALLDWLVRLQKFGFVLLENVPVEEGHVPAIQERINFQKMTHYGPGYTVEVREQPSSIAHTSHRIGLHTDLAFYDQMPGTVFLHCIKQHEGDGGETMLVDGFKAAHLLGERDPVAFSVLCKTVLRFRDVGSDYRKFNKLNKAPIFVFDAENKLKRIHWSHFARDSRVDLPLEEVEPLYRAMKAYDDILNDEEVHIKHKMRPGEMITIVNTRLMHGRTELSGRMSGRHLQCGYMDWDEIACRIRVLAQELNKQEY